MNDTTLGHLSEGEAVIPAEVLEANPQAAQSLDQTMIEMGIDPDSRTVDTTGRINGIESLSINPQTGLQEFGIGSAFQKLRRKVLKPVAKIAAVVPGPWQAPAIIYNKAESVYNIGKGEGGIGDLMTVMAGGSQKVGGKGGAFDRVMSGDFVKEGKVGEVAQATCTSHPMASTSQWLVESSLTLSASSTLRNFDFILGC